MAAALTGVQLGATIVATRYVIDQTDPVSLALLRYAIGALCLIPVALAARRVPWRRRDLVPVAFLGIVQFAGVVSLLNYALQTLPAGRTALIFATFPLLTMLFAAALGQERLSVARSTGVGLTLLGVGLILGEKAAMPESDGWLGEAAVLLSAASGALCSVLYRPYLQTYDPLPVGALAMLASVGFLGLLAAPQGFFVEPPALTAVGWLAVLFIGVSSGVGYWLWLWALRHASPTRVASFLALGPATAFVLGAFFLDEAVTALSLLGLAAVAGGLRLAHAA